METTELKFNSGSEAIIYFGRLLLANDPTAHFNLNDPVRREVYQKTYLTFTGGRECQRLNIKPHKGVLLVGDIGVGKTTMMKVMQKMFKDTPRRFKWVTALELKDLMDEISVAEIKEMYGKSLHTDLYIDDLGLGQVEKKHWGNVTNIIAEIIFERDELFCRESYKTHFSCNTTTDELEQMYGDRVLDRMKQMTNLITWKGASLRK